MYFEDFRLGMEVTLDETEIKKDEMIDFARRYDNLPIHTDEQYALGSNYGALIASGLFTLVSVWRKYIEKDFVGNELLGGKGGSTEWLAPVYAGDVLRGTARVTALTERSERNGIVQITIHAYNQNNVRVMLNVTEAVVKKRLK